MNRADVHPVMIRRTSVVSFRSARRGIVLAVIMVLLAIITLMAAGWARRIVAERQHLRSVVREAQAVRLAEIGLARGSAQLVQNAAYNGEVWEIPATDLDGMAATVRITLDLLDAAIGGTRITAQATYPAEGVYSVRRTRTTLVQSTDTPNP